uniref:Uncharacterized protein n=1 Tax=Human betaherpesvirus 6 TaxID=10368 RepID=A0A5P9S534_9BETA|nr:hypothetical protein [Human betaherpesvirus 6]
MQIQTPPTVLLANEKYLLSADIILYKEITTTSFFAEIILCLKICNTDHDGI